MTTRSTLPTRATRPARRRTLVTLRIHRRAWRESPRDQRRVAAEAIRALLRDLERGYTPPVAVDRANLRRPR